MFNKIINYKADYIEIGFIKTSAMAFALLFAKLYSPLLSLDWYWYLIIGIVAAYKPVSNCLSS